jgi:hypothetical protein
VCDLFPPLHSRQRSSITHPETVALTRSTPFLDKTSTRHQSRPRAHDPTAARCLLPHILLPLLLSLLARHGRPTPKPSYGDEHTGAHGTEIWRPTSTTARRWLHGYKGNTEGQHTRDRDGRQNDGYRRCSTRTTSPVSATPAEARRRLWLPFYFDRHPLSLLALSVGEIYFDFFGFCLLLCGR